MVKNFSFPCMTIFISIYAVLSLYLLFTLFCHEIFATIYAISYLGELSPKVHLWRKDDKYQVCTTQAIPSHYLSNTGTLLGHYLGNIRKLFYQHSGNTQGQVLPMCDFFPTQIQGLSFFVIHDICTFLKFIKIQNVKTGKKGNNCNHSLYLM